MLAILTDPIYTNRRGRNSRYIGRMGRSPITETDSRKRAEHLARNIAEQTARVIVDAKERRACDWTRRDHANRAQFLASAAEWCAKEWAVCAERAHRSTYGTAPEFHSYRVCGIGDDKYSEPDKEVLRTLAYGRSTLLDLADAHKRLAKRRTIPA